MPALLSTLLWAMALSGVYTAPVADEGASHELQKRTPSSEGWHDGFFYSWWSDGFAPTNYTNLEKGGYSVEWGNGGNFIGGKGWNPGTSTRVIEYSGTYLPKGTSALGVYGWYQNPNIEYFIIENFDVYDPSSGATQAGEAKCDGSTYKLARRARTDFTGVLWHYYSVRQDRRTGGVVHTACHFDAWKQAGFQLGSHAWQIVATEGYWSEGRSEITVSERKK